MSSESVLAPLPRGRNCASGTVVPMYVCPGCTALPLGYAMITLGDKLDELVECPAREVCTWYAGHDLGGDAQFNEFPAAAMLTPAFKADPYFSCENFDDHQRFIAAVKRAQQHAHVSTRRRLLATAEVAAESRA